MRDPTRGASHFCLRARPGLPPSTTMQASHHGSLRNNRAFGGCFRTRPPKEPRGLRLFGQIPGNSSTFA